MTLHTLDSRWSERQKMLCLPYVFAISKRSVTGIAFKSSNILETVPCTSEELYTSREEGSHGVWVPMQTTTCAHWGTGKDPRVMAINQLCEHVTGMMTLRCMHGVRTAVDWEAAMESGTELWPHKKYYMSFWQNWLWQDWHWQDLPGVILPGRFGFGWIGFGISSTSVGSVGTWRMTLEALVLQDWVWGPTAIQWHPPAPCLHLALTSIRPTSFPGPNNMVTGNKAQVRVVMTDLYLFPSRLD